jgi:hypothetical protein
MSRLAEYMAQVAALLGEPKSVHFRRQEPGSVILVQWVEREAAPKVRDRLERTRRGEGPADAINAVRLINGKLREDNGSGVLTTQDGGEILKFPGRYEEEPWTFGAFNQYGVLDGILIRIGGRNEMVPVHLQSGEVIYTACEAHRTVAKRLAPHIFTTELRVYGTGRWHRDESGDWILDRFTISDFTVLSDEPLTSVVTALRTIPGSEWPSLKDPWAELGAIRREADESC